MSVETPPEGLTPKFIQALRVERRTELPDKSERHKKPRKGLMLQANTSGNHTFLYRRMVKGQRYGYTIGNFPEMSLAKAREITDLINDHDDGPQTAIDELLQERQEPAPGLTVQRLINRYVEEECEPYNRNWKDQEWILNKELKPYLSLPADEISTDHVTGVVQACLDRGSPRSAQEALKQIKSMYNWAMGTKRVRRKEVRKQEATQVLVRKVIVDMSRNPAEGVIAPKYKPRTYHLSGKALKSFPNKLAASKVRDDCKDILLIQLQTFCRVGEVAGMRWDELDLDKRVWVIPAERYKTGVDHTVQLSRQTAKRLRQLKEGSTSAYVFPLPRGTMTPGVVVEKPVDTSTVGKQINKARDSLKQHEDFTSHSLRHSGSTWLASQHCPHEVRERLLGHAIDQSDMSQRYQHHEFMDERKLWTQKWCDYLAGG